PTRPAPSVVSHTSLDTSSSTFPCLRRTLPLVSTSVSFPLALSTLLTSPALEYRFQVCLYVKSNLYALLDIFREAQHHLSVSVKSVRFPRGRGAAKSDLWGERKHVRR